MPRAQPEFQEEDDVNETMTGAKINEALAAMRGEGWAGTVAEMNALVFALADDRDRLAALLTAPLPEEWAAIEERAEALDLDGIEARSAKAHTERAGDTTRRLVAIVRDVPRLLASIRALLHGEAALRERVEAERELRLAIEVGIEIADMWSGATGIEDATENAEQAVEIAAERLRAAGGEP